MTQASPSTKVTAYNENFLAKKLGAESTKKLSTRAGPTLGDFGSLNGSGSFQVISSQDKRNSTKAINLFPLQL